MLTPPPIRDQHRQERRERLRWLIARDWRKAGRRWTDAEIESAIDASIARQDAQTAPDSPRRPRATQATLFEADDATRVTRAEAYRRSRPRQSRRSDDVERWVAEAGRQGMTRDEIADRGIPLQSVCSIVRGLLRAGRLVSTPRTRATRTGSPAAVIVAASAQMEACE